MPFFLPRRLIEFEYLCGAEDAAYATEAEPYRKDMDFAFFAAQFGYSRADYDALTAREKAFVLKAWEDKTVRDTTLLRNAVLNAVGNALRKKGKPFRQLWARRQQRADADAVRAQIRAVREIDAKNKGAWLKKLRAAYGREV